MKICKKELDSLSEDQEKVIDERILANMRSQLCCIVNSELSEQIQNDLSYSKLMKDFYSRFSDLSKTINLLKEYMKNISRNRELQY